MRGFSEMLHSPAFNKQEIVIALFEVLREVFQNEACEIPSMEVLHEALFPGVKYQHQPLRYVMTDLTRLAENYLIQMALEKNEVLRARLLMGVYVDRQLDKYFSNTLDKALEKLEKKPLRDSSYLYQRFRLEEAGLNFDQQRRKRSGDKWIYPMLRDLEQFSLGTRLKYVCELVNRHNVVAGDLSFKIVEGVLEEVGHTAHADIPAILIYHQILLSLLESDDETHYQALRNSLRRHKEEFALEELGQMYAFALNYCIKKLNSGQTAYLRELFTLYQELMEGKIIYEGGYLPPQHFKNIVTVGIRLEEFSWAESFIEQYCQDIPEIEKENARIYNQASLAYARRDYSRSLQLLQRVEFTDVYYQLDSKSILLKSYFELGDFEPLISLIDSFKLYLRRNKTISEYQRTVYLNLVKYVRKLVRIRLGSRSPVQEILHEMEATKEIADLRWLRQKVDELM